MGISKELNSRYDSMKNKLFHRKQEDQSSRNKENVLENSNRFTLPEFDSKNKPERIRNNERIHAGFLPNKTEANEVYTIIWKVLSSIKIEKYSK